MALKKGITHKNNGKVFTPRNIVKIILDNTGYKSKTILKKHVIDNSFGDGAFLTVIVDRYCKAFLEYSNDLKILKKQLETYIHGIEIDKREYYKGITNLNDVASKYNLSDINWDLINDNTLDITKYDGKMDFVLGNPPYVRVHNLQKNYPKIKKYSFAQNGMTDLFIVFYEIGIKMLNRKGKLGYISPSSLNNSLASKYLREYLIDKNILDTVIDLEHKQVFNVTTYTGIYVLDNDKQEKSIYFNYFKDYLENKPFDIILYDDFYINNNFYFGNKKDLINFKIIIDSPSSDLIQVKNGFATLRDKIFYNNINSKDTIDVIKASTGQWKKCIYPYNDKGVLKEFENLDYSTREYLLENKESLESRSLEKNSKWYAFGRSQGIKDVQNEKYSINTLIRNVEDLKIHYVPVNCGVYSGLYILGNTNREYLEKILKTDEFMNYIRVLGKYKSGGYYTFSSKELHKFISSKI